MLQCDVMWGIDTMIFSKSMNSEELPAEYRNRHDLRKESYFNYTLMLYENIDSLHRVVHCVDSTTSVVFEDVVCSKRLPLSFVPVAMSIILLFCCILA